jgi:rhodanese-related sulfurtransferase
MNDKTLAIKSGQKPGRQTCRSMVEQLASCVQEIFPWDLVDELEPNPELILLDVRSRHEFHTASIKNSINVPRGILELAVDYGYEETEPMLVESRNKRIVLICRSGNRSVLAAHTLAQMGYTDVASLRTGIRGWNDYEQPLFSTDDHQLSLDTADELLAPRFRPAQLGPPANAQKGDAACGPD